MGSNALELCADLTLSNIVYFSIGDLLPFPFSQNDLPPIVS
ncbi:hypothetical protein [Nonomuraea sp. NPDC049684]